MMAVYIYMVVETHFLIWSALWQRSALLIPIEKASDTYIEVKEKQYAFHIIYIFNRSVFKLKEGMLFETNWHFQNFFIFIFKRQRNKNEKDGKYRLISSTRNESVRNWESESSSVCVCVLNFEPRSRWDVVTAMASWELKRLSAQRPKCTNKAVFTPHQISFLYAELIYITNELYSFINSGLFLNSGCINE